MLDQRLPQRLNSCSIVTSWPGTSIRTIVCADEAAVIDSIGTQMVRNRIHSMVDRGELARDTLGQYSLAPDIWHTRLLRHEPEEVP